MGDPVSMLQEMDARARAITLREVRWVRSGLPLGRPPESHSFPVIRAASRERMRIRHALAALRTPAQALAALRVV